MTGPRGPKPKSAITFGNVFVYGTITILALYYLTPLYVMLVTSLKGMPEVRLGNVFALPQEITFEPWIKAWVSACTGLNCNGLAPGFWNSVRILIPKPRTTSRILRCVCSRNQPSRTAPTSPTS